jgi:biotin operon repressor
VRALERRHARTAENGSVETLAELRERRAFECRLTAGRALASLAEADAFLRDRGLLTRTPDCALPSLYEACHEDPYQPGRRGFATWPATKWPWFGELGERGYLVVAVHGGKNLLVTDEVAGLIDPICRAEIERMRAADRACARLLDHLADAGPSSIDDLRAELGLTRQALKSLRAQLERCGAIVSRSLEVTAGRGHLHTSELSRWDQVHRHPDQAGADPARAFRDLLVAGVGAAVVAPEAELRRWFSWPWYWTDTLVDELTGEGRLRRVDGQVTAAG